MVDIYTDLRALEDEACHKFETRVAVEAAEREREADKEWADMDDFFDPDNSDDDPDEEAPVVGFEEDPEAQALPGGT